MFKRMENSPRFKLSNATTAQSGRSRAIMQARLEPTKPAPPVMAMRFVISLPNIMPAVFGTILRAYRKFDAIY